MEFDPHTLQQIIRKIEQQMRCPQCGKRVPVDFASVRLAGDGFMLLQLRCDTCDAYIVLHASLQGVETIGFQRIEKPLSNASSTLSLRQEELTTLRQALEHSGGSFTRMFQTYGQGEVKPPSSSGTAIV